MHIGGNMDEKNKENIITFNYKKTEQYRTFY